MSSRLIRHIFLFLIGYAELASQLALAADAQGLSPQRLHISAQQVSGSYRDPIGNVRMAPVAQATEQQVFAIAFDVRVDIREAIKSLYCEIAGRPERIPVRHADAALVSEQRQRNWILHSFITNYQTRQAAKSGSLLLVQCGEPLPVGSKGAVVVDVGLTSVDGLRTLAVKRLAFETIPAFTATFECQRSVDGRCAPTRPIKLKFSHPIRPEDAKQIWLEWPGGQYNARADNPYAPKILKFAGPFPPLAALSLRVPAGLRDAQGHELAASASSSLELRTAPLAYDWLLPRAVAVLPAQPAPQLTVGVPEGEHIVRHEVRMMRLRAGDAQLDKELIDWVQRLRKAIDPESPALGPLLGEAPANRTSSVTLPVASSDPAHRSALPLPGKGFYLLEWPAAVASDGQKPSWIQTAALVTDLRLYVREGAESSIVWVTSISSGRPAPGATVHFLDCEGKPVWEGTTDRDGLVRIARPIKSISCNRRTVPVFVTARLGDDISFAPSLALLNYFVRPVQSPELTVETIFDTAVLAPGATVHMKHFARVNSMAGLELPPASTPRVSKGSISRWNSQTRFPFEVHWNAGQAETAVTLPMDAPHGDYNVWIENMPAGHLRVEAAALTQTRALVDAPNIVVLDGAAPPALTLNVINLKGGPGVGQVRLSTALSKGEQTFDRYPGMIFANGLPGDDGTLWKFGQGPGAVRNARLDGAGKAYFELLTGAGGSRVRNAVANFAFEDESGKTRWINHSMTLLPGSELVGLRAPTFVLKDMPLRVEAAVMDAQGKPLAGRMVHLSMLEEGVERALCSEKTGADGFLTCNVEGAPAQPFVILARGAGSAAAHRKISPTGPDPTYADKRGGLAIAASAYQDHPGKPALLGMAGGFEAGWMLVTIERYGVLDAFVQPIRSPGKELVLPVLPAYAPGVAVNVAQTRPLRDLTPDAVARAAANFREGKVDFLRVTSAQQPLRVAVRTDRAEYKPGTVAQVDIEVADNDGSAPPLGTEVTLIAVDVEAVHLDNFVPVWPQRTESRPFGATFNSMPATGKSNMYWSARIPRDISVMDIYKSIETRDIWGLVDSLAFAAALPPSAGVSLNPGGAVRQQEGRYDFKPTVFWRGSVQLDARGEAHVELPLNDSHTRFRVMAVANSGARGFGYGATEVVTRRVP